MIPDLADYLLPCIIIVLGSSVFIKLRYLLEEKGWQKSPLRSLLSVGFLPHEILTVASVSPRLGYLADTLNPWPQLGRTLFGFWIYVKWCYFECEYSV